MTNPRWQPSASLKTLKQAATLRSVIRHYMDNLGVLEVSTPILSQAATTDPQLHSFTVQANGQTRYLHTSPEFPMKRLLAAHQHDIYQIVPVFRDAEHGARHNPEFTMLEWYRVGMDHIQLMESIEELLQAICKSFDKPWQKPQTKTYNELVEGVIGTPIEDITQDAIKNYFNAQDRSYPESPMDVDAALDLFIDTFVLPTFKADQFTFITNYPASQAALARTAVDDKGKPVASRFELYYGALEIANGYHELTDATELKQRIENDIATRVANDLNAVPADALLVEAHQAGLPDCAGVAVGLERLLMLLTNAHNIADVVSFDFERA